MNSIDVSRDLISTLTDAILEEVAAWQQRPLDLCYPLASFDAIRIKIRDAQDILITVVDSLKGFPEAINAVFPPAVA